MTQMNPRLEIASRFGTGRSPEDALYAADRLIAEEARTRPPADAPAPDDLRAVAEAMLVALELMVMNKVDYMLINKLGDAEKQRDVIVARTARARARAIVLTGGAS